MRLVDMAESYHDEDNARLTLARKAMYPSAQTHGTLQKRSRPLNHSRELKIKVPDESANRRVAHQ
jgi:hypothetical protein